jgi:hypothetical protein
MTAPDTWQTGLGEHPRHRSTVHGELPSDGGGRPFLDVVIAVIAQDLSIAFRRCSLRWYPRDLRTNAQMRSFSSRSEWQLLLRFG